MPLSDCGGAEGRSAYNSAFPATWKPAEIDAAIRQWSDQNLAIKASLTEAFAAMRREKEDCEALEREKQAALAWCRANGDPHLPTPAAPASARQEETTRGL